MKHSDRAAMRLCFDYMAKFVAVLAVGCFADVRFPSPSGGYTAARFGLCQACCPYAMNYYMLYQRISLYE